LTLLGLTIWLHYAPKEIFCRSHGRIQEDIPWAAPMSRITHRLEFRICALCPTTLLRWKRPFRWAASWRPHGRRQRPWWVERHSPRSSPSFPSVQTSMRTPDCHAPATRTATASPAAARLPCRALPARRTAPTV
jgi:hypothetical protein